MKKFIDRLLNSIKPCAGVVHAPRLRSALPMHEARVRGHASASSALVSRGSVAMARFPLVTEKDLASRREKILGYEFASFK